MRQLKEICTYLETFAPLDSCESWDNCGILIEGEKEIHNVLVTLDITDAAIKEAVKKNCQLIIAHHPVIFKPLKSLKASDIAFQLVQHNLSAICMHTNMDKAEGGVNDVLAGLIGLMDVEEFAGIGRMGSYDASMKMSDYAKKVANALGVPVKYSLPDKEIQKVCLIGGSAGDFWEAAHAEGMDVLLTGEASHHYILDAAHEGLAILVAGHWGTEAPIAAALVERLGEMVDGVKFIEAKSNTNPVSYCMPE